MAARNNHDMPFRTLHRLDHCDRYALRHIERGNSRWNETVKGIKLRLRYGPTPRTAELLALAEGVYDTYDESAFDAYDDYVEEYWDEYQSMRLLYAHNPDFPKSYELYLAVRHQYLRQDYYPYDYDDYLLEDIDRFEPDPYGDGREQHFDFTVGSGARFYGEY